MGKAKIIKNLLFPDMNLGVMYFKGEEFIKIIAEDSYVGEAEKLSIQYNTSKAVAAAGVLWSIESGDDYAEIDQDGVLTIKKGASENTVVVKAVSVKDESLSDAKSIVVTYSYPGTELPTGTITNSYVTVNIDSGNVITVSGRGGGQKVYIYPSLTNSDKKGEVLFKEGETYRYIVQTISGTMTMVDNAFNVLMRNTSNSAIGESNMHISNNVFTLTFTLTQDAYYLSFYFNNTFNATDYKFSLQITKL